MRATLALVALIGVIVVASILQETPDPPLIPTPAVSTIPAAPIPLQRLQMRDWGQSDDNRRAVAALEMAGVVVDRYPKLGYTRTEVAIAINACLDEVAKGDHMADYAVAEMAVLCLAQMDWLK